MGSDDREYVVRQLARALLCRVGSWIASPRPLELGRGRFRVLLVQS